MSKRSRENREQRKSTAVERQTIPPWLAWVTAVGIAFLTGFVLAALIFSNYEDNGVAEAGANETTDESPVYGPSEPPTDETTGERLYSYEEVQQMIAQAYPLNEPSPRQNQPVHHTEEDDPAIGSADAPVTIVEYSDFSCSYCKRFADETLPQIIDAYGDEVRFVYRDAPVLGAVEAAAAAECADEQGQFWAYHDYLFANRDKFNEQSFVAMARRLGLDVDTFTACLNSEAISTEINEDFEAGRLAGLGGTPFFTVNGEPISGAQPFEAFQSAIDTALAEANN
jgi:protein-disulfide isomerase